MKDLFYRPKIGPERDYMSDGIFESEQFTSIPDIEETTEETSFETIVEEIDKVLQVIDALPEGIIAPFKTGLNKIKDDIKDMIESMPPEPVPGPQPTPAPQAPEVPIGESRPDSNLDPIRRDKENNIVLTDSGKKEFSIFPDDNGISVELEEKVNLIEYARTSFIKDKQDMYSNFVKKLKLMIQQYMREILYVAKKGEFDSYKDLYIKYDVATAELPEQLKHVGDRITKSQISRDQKTRMLSKTFSIDQTIYHLIANKVSYEQRERYYDTPYHAGTDYLSTRENDELRRAREDYDKRYEQSMYNYYKYLNSSVILAEEVLQSFVSESRGKSILKKNGIDITKGVKKEEALKESRQEKYRKENEAEYKEEMKKKQKKIDMLKKAGKI